MATSELKTYHGNCHCGAFKFTVKLPEIKTATECNCSVCFKKAYLWSFPVTEDFVVERGEDALTDYEFNAKTMAHRFCKTCGTGVMGYRHGTVPGGKNIGVNVRTLMGVDPFLLDVKLFDGKSKYQPPYVSPQFTGELPKFEGEGLKVYTGSCHCGAVTLAIKNKPLPEDTGLKEDNCSICQRNGYTFVYPSPEQVTIVGVENTNKYEFGTKIAEHHFCKTCGVPLYVKMNGPPKEVLETLPAAERETMKKYVTMMPINLRVMNDVEWDDLKVQRFPIGPEGYTVD